MKGWRLLVASAALVSLVAQPVAVRAEEPVESAGWGVLAVFANVGYMPAKTIYALMGGLTGGLAFLCTGGDLDTASSIWEPSLGGTYVLTPGMIRGEDQILFAGPSSATERSTGQSATDPGTTEEQLGEGSAPDVIDDGSRSRGRNEEALPAS
jgi:hypothetical protein